MIEFGFYSNLYSLKSVRFLPVELSRAWNFFSSPENLSLITPQKMKFRITSPRVFVKLCAGEIITYRVNPFPFIRVNWVTEIAHVAKNEYFIDVQRFGPYRFWYHMHMFRETEGGIFMTDMVYYKLPFGFLGRIAHSLFVKKQLTYIFNYRNKRLKEIF